MKFAQLARTTALTFGIAAGGSLLADSASAIPILTFGQVGGGTPVTATENSPALGITTIVTNTAVTVTQIAAALPVSFNAFLKLTMVSADEAINIGTFIQQNFDATFCITSAVNCGGSNYLSGTIVDGSLGSLGRNAQMVAAASTPPATDVTFTSDYITALEVERAAGFTFTGVVPLLHIVNGPGDQTIGSFQAAIAGNFSAEAIPEPASLALLGMGLVGLGLIARRRNERH